MTRWQIDWVVEDGGRDNGGMFKWEFAERRNRDKADHEKEKVGRGDRFRQRQEGNRHVVVSRLARARGGGEGKRLG